MALKDDLATSVTGFFTTVWNQRKGQVVPEPSNVTLGNDAVNLNGVVLYADMSGSTKLVDDYFNTFAAKIYKSYLHCAAKIIKSEGGKIVSYDGDRVMAVFIGERKNSRAVSAAMKINYARINIINPTIKKIYDTDYELSHSIGIDASPLFIAKTGVRGDNDLVWVGKAANHAAKLCEIGSNEIYISSEVYNLLAPDVKSYNDKNMWESTTWTSNGRAVYSSTWYWSF